MLERPNNRRYVQANSSLQRWNSNGATKLGGSCREEAAARKLPRGALGMDALTTERYAGTRPARHFKRFKGFEGWQTAGLNALTTDAMCRQTAGCKQQGSRKTGSTPFHCCGRGEPLSHCCGLVVAFACGSGVCWACWGTFCLRSWADFWRVWSVWSVVAPVGLVGVPFACEVGRFACGSVRSWADFWRVWSVWQTAGEAF